MEKFGKNPKESLSDMDVPSSTSDAPMVANRPILMIKTKAAYKQYPPSILYGKGLKTSKRKKRAPKKSLTKTYGEEVAPPEPKQVKETPVTGESQPLVEQPEKQAEEQAIGEASAAAAAAAGKANEMAISKMGSPHTYDN